MLTTEDDTLAQDRTFDLSIAQTVIELPCFFFPSVSSVKTNLMPVDYVELPGRRYTPALACISLRHR